MLFRAVFYRSSNGRVSIFYLSALFALGTQRLNQLICIATLGKQYPGRRRDTALLFSSSYSHSFWVYIVTSTFTTTRVSSLPLFYTLTATTSVRQLLKEVNYSIFRKLFDISLIMRNRIFFILDLHHLISLYFPKSIMISYQFFNTFS